VIERTGPNAATDASPVGADKLPNIADPATPGYRCPPSTVLGLQGKSQIDVVKNSIDSYVAGGGTAGHIGTAWGWYLLSPQWASVLGASAPKSYGDPMVEKNLLIMTDGEFNLSWVPGVTSSGMADSSYAQFQDLCTGAKSQGIKIFTIGFALNVPRALTELQNCATGNDYFFDAKTGADLKAAFKDIAKKLNTLRVAG
jgi:hypothetical protein